MKNVITLSAPNKKVALGVSKETGNIGVISKKDAVLFIETAIKAVEKTLTREDTLLFKDASNTHHDAYIDCLTYKIENRLMKVLEGKLGFLPQDMKVIRVLVKFVCDRDRAIKRGY